MSMEALRWARMPRPGLGGPAAAVLRDLADRANETSVCWPSIATIAAETGLSERTVQRAVRKLESGRLIVTKRTGRGSCYTLQLADQIGHSVLSEVSESPIRGVTLTPKASRSLKKHSAPAAPTAKAAAGAYVTNHGEIPDVVELDDAMLELAYGWLRDSTKAKSNGPAD